MNKYLLILFISFPILSAAQTLSIEQVWEQIDKTYQDRKQVIQIEVARTSEKITKLEQLPTVYGEVSMQRNLIIPTTPVPAIAFDPTAAEDAIRPLQFATKWSSKAGIQAQWDLFDPTKITSRKQLSFETAEALLQQQQSRQEWKKKATMAYAGVVLAKLQYEYAQVDSIGSEEILQISKKRYEAGREKPEDYSNARQNYERKKITASDAHAIWLDSQFELQKYISLAPPYTLTSDFDKIQQSVAKEDYRSYEPELIQLQGDMAELQIQNSKRKLLPSLRLNAFYGSQFYNNQLNLTHLSNWYGNSYVNLTLHTPLSDLIVNNQILRKYRLEKQLNNELLEERLESDKIENTQRAVRTHAVEERIKNLQNILQIALQHKQQAFAAYQAGRELVDYYIKATTECSKTSQEIWQAKYDWLSALLL